MLNTLKKLSVTLIILIIAILYLSEIATTYKFGILTEEYSKINKYNELLNKEPKYLAVNKNINKYSWNTPLKLPNSNIKIKVEHLVVANNADIALIPKVKDEKNFLTTIEYLQGQVISIKIENKVDDYLLKQKGMYAYVKSTKKNQNFDTIEINNNINLYHQKNYVAIGFIFPFHEEFKTNILDIQKYQFNEAYQKITIQYFNNQNNIQKEEYIFNLKWYYHMTGWDKFITIT
jgi:hypothetical protein